MTINALYQYLQNNRWWIALNRRLKPDDIQSICLLILVINAIFFGLVFVTQVRGQTVFGPQLGADFGAYYIAGKIYHAVAPERIYEREQQRQLYHELFPAAPPDEELPFLNAPFFVLPFLLLAWLSYQWAYLLWLSFSLGVYMTGFKLLYQSCPALPKGDYKTSLLLALSFMPFLVECLAGGQTSAIGFFSLALALSLELQGSRLLSGLALSLCLYKPTLLLLVAPMLILTRRFSTVLGFTIGSSLLSLASWLIVGTQGCWSYLKLLTTFAAASTGGETIALKSWKYIDLNSFFRLLTGEFIYLRWTLTGIVFLASLRWLLKCWLSFNRAQQQQEPFVWAITLTWSLILNVYLGIYDTTLVVLSVLLTTHFIYQRSQQSPIEYSPAYKLLLVLLYLVPWVTQLIAQLTGIQIFTLVIAMFGSYQMRLFFRDRHNHQALPGR